MPTNREELQSQRLNATSAYIQCLLRDAIDEVGEKNVVLGGFSQGRAAAAVPMLS